MREESLKKDGYDYKRNIELIELSKNGNKAAKEELVQNNLPLVASISRKFINRGYEYEDIFQIGCMGLVKAINNFDTKYEVKFSTYAVPMIVGEIKRFLRDDGMIKVSRSIKNMAKKIHYDREALTKKLNRNPTLEELSEYSGVSVEDILFASESSNNLQYLYDVIHQDDGAPVMLIDKIGEGQSEDMLDRLTLKEVLVKLDNKSRQVILLRYFKDKTQIQVAKMLGISQVQVSRIEKKVLKIMREKLSG